MNLFLILRLSVSIWVSRFVLGVVSAVGGSSLGSGIGGWGVASRAVMSMVVVSLVIVDVLVFFVVIVLSHLFADTTSVSQFSCSGSFIENHSL